MTDAEKRSLKSYLKNVLGPALKYADAAVIDWTGKESAAKPESLDHDIAMKMRRYHQGKAEAYTYAIDEFNELFAEDLIEDGEIRGAGEVEA